MSTRSTNEVTQIVERIYDNARCAIGDVLTVAYRNKRVRCTVFLREDGYTAVNPWHIVTFRVRSVGMLRGNTAPTFMADHIEVDASKRPHPVPQFMASDQRCFVINPDNPITVVAE